MWLCFARARHVTPQAADLLRRLPPGSADGIVAIVGFGGEGSSAYWIVQNSFGSVWGESGYFRIKRASALQAGEHNLGIESPRVSWAMPASA